MYYNLEISFNEFWFFFGSNSQTISRIFVKKKKNVVLFHVTNLSELVAKWTHLIHMYIVYRLCFTISRKRWRYVHMLYAQRNVMSCVPNLVLHTSYFISFCIGFGMCLYICIIGFVVLDLNLDWSKCYLIDDNNLRISINNICII